MTVGKGTKMGRDLVERAKAVAELMREQTDLKFQVKAAQEQINERLKDAADCGFDKKALLQCVKEMCEDEDKRQLRLDFESTVDDYRLALDLIPGGAAFDESSVETRASAEPRGEPAFSGM